MGTPQAVLDAEAEAERLISELSGGATPPSDDQDESEPTPEAAGDDSDSGQEGEAEPVASGSEPEPRTSNDDIVAELQAKLEKLQAQYDTLRGKTYAEVPRVLNENKALRDEIAALKNQIQTAPASTATSRPQMGKKASDILAALKEDVNEEVADKILMLVNAALDEGVAARIQPFETKIGNLQEVAVKQSQEAYVRELTKLVPDWRQIAESPDYSNFLSQKDEVSGQTLYDLAVNALNNLDAAHMSVFFNKYKKSKGIATEPTKASGPRPTGKAALLSPKSTVRTASRDESGEKVDIITTKQLEQWNKERKTMTPEQEAKLDARIDRAIQNGWIKPV